jgi:hypothetical protein
VAGESLVLLVTSGTAAAVAVFAAVRQWRTERFKPAVDAATSDRTKADEDHLRATIKTMADETNRSRDYRIWQLEGYIDLDRRWHREMIILLEGLVDQLRLELASTGRTLPDVNIPDPPQIPEPPHG